MPLLNLLRQVAKLQTKRGRGRSRNWRNRVRQIEKLESRHMLAAAIWHNVLQPLDVSGDVGGGVDPLDVLVMINEINDPRFSNRGSLPPEVPAGTSTPFFDVDCDSAITPLDVLTVINAINSRDYAPSWNFQTDNGNSAGSGRVTISSCSPMLIEGNSLSTELNKTLPLPNAHSSLRVTFSAPAFDTASQNRVRDAFEILVLDDNGQLLTLPYSIERDASLNWSESLDPVVGPSTESTSQPTSQLHTATFNLSGLPAGTKVQIAARLLNNDGDTNTSVVIQRVEFADAPAAAPRGMAVAAPNLNRSLPTDLEQLVDVSSAVKPQYGKTTFIEESNVLVTELGLSNTGSNAVEDDLIAVVTNMSNPAVGVLHPDGFLPTGLPYFQLRGVATNGWLSSGQSTEMREIRFKLPSQEPFQFDINVLARPNLAPTKFVGSPSHEIESGHTYEFIAQASDPEGQVLKYSLMAGPANMAINSTTGLIQWTTSNEDIGNHSVTIQATDPFGLSTQLSFHIAVLQTVQNRPPIITSVPTTNAEVAGTFEVLTYPTGQGPVSIAAGNLGNGTVFITANANSNNLSIVNGQQSSHVELGEPPPDGRFFRTGNNVDVGFPEINHSDDLQRLDSVAQGDLNGDGILDFVTANFVLAARLPSGPRTRSLSVMFGKGDGTFHEALSLPIRTVFNDSNENQRPVTSVTVGDFDGDQKQDILAISYSELSATEQNQILFWHGNGDGTFATLAIRNPDEFIGRVQAVDFNGDQKLDLVATTASWDRMGVLLGNGDGTFGAFTELLNSPNAGYYHTEGIADLDGKNGLDIAVTSYNRRTVDVYLNDGTGKVTLANSLSTDGRDPLGLFVGEFTGDAVQDIVMMTRTGSDGGGLFFYQGSGDGIAFTMTEAGLHQPLAPVNINSYSAIVDLNRDGKLDLVFSHHESSSGVTVALNDGNGKFDLQTYQNVSPASADGWNEIQELSVLVGDYNRDGILDLAVPSSTRGRTQTTADLTLFLALAPAQFGAPADFNYIGTGGNAGFTGINYAADFNNDGNVDIFGVTFQNSHRIRFGNGDGTLQAAVVSAPNLGNEFTSSGFHADFDRDGLEDVLWLGNGGVQGGPGARVIVGINQGDGVFQMSTYSNPDGDYYYMSSVARGDFNGDGFIDFAGRLGGAVDVWLYDSIQSKFVRSIRLGLPAGDPTQVISVSDFDGDQIDDIVTATGRKEGQAYSLLHTFTGIGNGQFDPIQTQTLFASNSDAGFPKWSATGDINNDGRMDLVITSAYSRSSVLLGNGNGSFRTPEDYITGTFFASTRSVYLKDLDQDGNLDMIAIDDNQRRNAIRIRPGKGDGTFGTEESYVTAGSVGYIDFADIDRDGAIDLVYGVSSNGYNVSEILYGRRRSQGPVAIVDLNGDAHQDLVSINYANNHVKVLLGNGKGTLSRQADHLVGNGPVAVGTLDFNNDSRPDIVTANHVGKSVSLLAANSQGGFDRSDVSVGFALDAMAIGDVTGDGNNDIVVASSSAKSLFLLKRNATGFDQALAIPLGDAPGQVALGDLSGDGVVDVVVSLPNSKRLMILPSRGNGQFDAPSYLNLTASAYSVGVADFNLDGAKDIAVSIPSNNEVALLFGRGNGQFAKPQTMRVGADPQAMAVQDVNADGLVDLIVANQGDNTSSVIINHYDPNKVYRYRVTAYDPDGDVVRFELAESPGGLLLNEVTGEIVWAPTTDQIGLNQLVVSANDGRGGLATQSYRVDVVPTRENSAPVIVTQPPTTLDAAQPYVYQASSIDADHDTLRYRLLEGPAGASIDPVTGTLAWDPRGSTFDPIKYRGDEAFVTVPFPPSLYSASLTVEGLFKLDSVDHDQAFFRKFSYNPYPFTVNSFSLQIQFGLLNATIAGTNGEDIMAMPWSPQANRWYHLAMSFDGVTGRFEVYVDGSLAMSKISDRQLHYDGVEMMIGRGNSEALIGSVANFRMWNYARSQSQLQAGVLSQYSATEPGLLLDYRFDQNDSQTIRDHSQFGHHGRIAVGRGPWPKPGVGLAEQQTQRFVIQTDDGRGGVAKQAFDVQVVLPFQHAIQGQVFSDDDGDGFQDPSESTLRDRVVFVDSNNNHVRDAGEPFGTTNETGQYRILGQIAGEHRVQIEETAGYAPPMSAIVQSQAFADTQISLGLIPLAGAILRGSVKIDVDRNGTWESTTDRLAIRWPVYVDKNNNELLDSDDPMAMTDDRGNFAFGNLSPGDYLVRVNALAGWTTLSPASGQYRLNLVANQQSVGNDFLIQATPTAASQPRWITLPPLSANARTEYRFTNTALDPNNHTIRYSLAVAPAGMSIDPDTGSTVWTASLSQIGNHRVLLKATNSLGQSSLQEFEVIVDRPNTEPIITSTPPVQSQVGVAYHYAISSQDAERTELNAVLLTAPPGATLETNSGLLSWSPTLAQLGNHPFVIAVSDAQGGQTVQSFNVNVAPANGNSQPRFTSTIRTTTTIGASYVAHVSGADPDGDQLRFSLVRGPAGLTIDEEGWIRWTPSREQLGPNSLRIAIDDGRGGKVEKDFELEVVSTIQNVRPDITSSAPKFARPGAEYRYDAFVVDQDNDPLEFELLAGPIGLSLDSQQGRIRWIPQEDQLGTSTVTFRARDPWGGFDDQKFQVNVERVGGSPNIASIPPTTAAIGVAYLYSVVAEDREGDPLEYSLLQSPSGMLLDSVTGELSWTPAASQFGMQSVIIRVRDGLGGFSTQAFSIQVLTGRPNQAPAIVTAPIYQGTAGTLYQYDIQANDPEGSTLTYSLRRGPAGMTVDAGTGEVRWTPAASDVGTHVIALVATDEQGAAAVQSFELKIVAQNQVPSIRSLPITSATVGAEYHYDLIATDPDLDPLAFELVEAPGGLAIDAFGRLRWVPTLADLGPKNVRVRVSDARGGVDEQSFSIQVVRDTTPPRVAVLPASLIVRANSPEVFEQYQIPPVYPSNTVRVSAIDNVGVTQLTVTANGQPVVLDRFGNAVFHFQDWGFATVTVVATARDAAGNETIGAKAFAFLPYGDDPAVADLANPEAVITSPSESSSIGGLVDIIGSASSDNFKGYTLSYRRADKNDSRVIANGTTKVQQGLLGRWDTTMLQNDSYVLRLEVEDEIFGTTAYEMLVGVSGKLKLGEFRVSFTDISINVGSLSVSLNRAYDSLLTDTSQDFGFGWSLDYRNTNLKTNLPKTGLEDLGIYSAFKPGTKVYLTLPGGTRQGFTFTPELRVLPGFGGGGLTVATPKFTPDRGVTSRLSASGGTFIVNANGELVSSGGQPFNPAALEFGGGYTLTLADGTIYKIDGDSGKLLSVLDRRQNYITFSDQGIESSMGDAIEFRRDTLGRIVEAIDPAGKKLQYKYDRNGDLVEVIDREGNRTQYVYRLDRPHHLDQIIDPLGQGGTRVEYDADGRLSTVIDGKGQKVRTTFDIAHRLETTTDALGRTSIVEYDDRGNVVQLVDARGGITRTSFDANDNPVSVTDALGRTTRRTYDDFGNVLTTVDPRGNQTVQTYSSTGRIVSLTDALGNTFKNEYDTSNNLIAQVNPFGQRAAASYSASGALDKVIGFDGVSFTVDERQGRLNSVSVDQVMSAYAQYDDNGLPTSIAVKKPGSSNQQTLLRVDRDNNGRPLKITYANGGTDQYEYDAAGNRIKAIDPLGRVTQYEYDSLDNLTRTLFPDGSSELRTYDAANQLITVSDRAGRTTRFEYNAAGQQTAVLYPDLSPSDWSDNPRVQFEYDAVGQLVSTTDERNKTTRFQYDLSGNLVRITDALGFTQEKAYDGGNRLIETVDAVGSVTRYAYDALGNNTLVRFADGNSDRATYDSRGHMTSATNALGETTTYEYDSQGLLIRVVDPLGNATEYGRNEFGQVTTQQDALGRVTTFEYNAMGQLAKRLLPTGEQESYRYDLAGQLIAVVDFLGRTTNIEYDVNGRATKITYADGSINETQWTATGKPLSIREGTYVTQYEYDTRDRLIRKIDPDGQTVRYEYDDAGNVTQIATIGGVMNYSYDALARPILVSASTGTTILEYDANGRLVTKKNPNNTTETLKYDNRSRVTEKTLSGSGGVLERLQMEYDAVGRRVGALDNSGRLEHFGYDANGRLISRSIAVLGNQVRQSEYQYDAVGNRVKLIDSVGGITSYQYDQRDRLLKEINGNSIVVSTYDASGNLLEQIRSETDRTLFDWDSRGRLVRTKIIQGSQTSTVDYAYSPDGERYSRSTNGATTRFIVDTRRQYPTILAEVDGEAVTVAYVRLPDEPGAMSQTRQQVTTYVFANTLGSVKAATNQQGEISDRIYYDAFGTVIERTGTTLLQELFNGEYRDSATGLDYLRARTYSPDIGRFISMDSFSGSLTNPASLNKYSFAHNDPVNANDPSGKFTLTEQQINFAIVGTFTAMGAAYGYFRPRAKGESVAGNVVFYGLAGFGIGVVSVAFGGAALVSRTTLVSRYSTTAYEIESANLSIAKAVTYGTEILVQNYSGVLSFVATNSSLGVKAAMVGVVIDFFMGIGNYFLELPKTQAPTK